MRTTREIVFFVSTLLSTSLMADEILIIDDRQRGDMKATIGTHWRAMTDDVMGGITQASLRLASKDGNDCLRLQGDVRLENNGGFAQATLDLAGTEASDASAYQGLQLLVYGNGEEYNVHLRTEDVWLPWQSYRASFHAPARWQSIKLPFTDFTGYRISKKLDLQQLTRIGLVAIGREFTADLCIARLAYYKEND